MTAVTSSLRNLLSPFCKDKFLEQSLIQDPSSRPGPDDGCFRLWLEWSHPPLCYKGHLVGIGSVQIHQREGIVGNSFVRALHETHPGWQACGNSHRQRGSFLLFKEDGFAALTSDDGPCQAVSIFVHRTLHYIRGPSYSWFAKCPCGRWIERQTQCHRRLPGPRNFVVVFRSGRLRFSNSGRLMCYQGEYEVQPICLSVRGLPPKLCGVGCQGGGLVAIPANLPVPPSFNSSRSSFQDNKVFRKGSSNCPLSEWPCFGPDGLKGEVKATASRFIFPLSDKGWRSGKKKEVLRLLDVGIIDIPIPSLPEPPASGSWSHPSTSSAPLPFSGSTPQVQPTHAAESLVESPESLTSVRRRRFLSLGLSRGTRKILKTISLKNNQPVCRCQVEILFLREKEEDSKSRDYESTVLNYLSSRLQDPERRRKGKLAPLSLRSVGISHILEGV